MNIRTILLLMIAGLTLTGCEDPKPQPAGETYQLTLQAQSVPWNTPHAKGQQLITDHYRIYTTVKKRSLLKYLPGLMEASYSRYLTLTGLSDRPQNKRMPMYIMSTRKEWASLTQHRLGKHAGAALSISAGGYCYDGVCVLWDIGPRGTLSVAAHEGLHQFFAHRLAQSLPMWFEEGICVLAEGHQMHKGTLRFTPGNNPGRITALRNAIVNSHWKTIDQLLPMDAGDAVGTGRIEKAVAYYGQVWSLAMFIRSQPIYNAGMQRMIADAQDGKIHNAMGLTADALKKLKRRGRAYNRTIAAPIFEHYICDDLERFEREYMAFSRELAGL
ncbi:MAG: hypothetical protein HN350_01675 [Phycisphaerales bacterium]|nr:hypothetical protein [Phycisphaerales bacterium]